MKENKETLLGEFQVNDRRLPGALILSPTSVSLSLWSTTFFDVPLDTLIRGNLNNNRDVTLFGCFPTTSYPTFTASRTRSTQTATVIANHAVFGPGKFDPSERCIKRVSFRTDDTNILFNDRRRFTVQSGHDSPQIQGTYSGPALVFSTATEIGVVSARHYIQSASIVNVSDGLSIATKVHFEIEFQDTLSYGETMQRIRAVVVFVALLVGRPQVLLDLRLETLSSHESKDTTPPKYDVHCHLYPTYERDNSRPERLILGLMIDVAGNVEEFNTIITEWLARHCEWRDARERFYTSMEYQRRYVEDRIIGAANMFDLLPSSAVGPERVIPESSLEAISEARRILKQGRIDPSDNDDPCNEALRRLGAIRRKALRQRVHFRAKKILGHVGGEFPDLFLVIDQAIKCRNVFVHGASTLPASVYVEQLGFLTRTLEFVFGISDLIEAGWDVQGWLDGRKGFNDAFGTYAVGYSENLKTFKRWLNSHQGSC